MFKILQYFAAESNCQLVPPFTKRSDISIVINIFLDGSWLNRLSTMGLHLHAIVWGWGLKTLSKTGSTVFVI